MTRNLLLSLALALAGMSCGMPQKPGDDQGPDVLGTMESAQFGPMTEDGGVAYVADGGTASPDLTPTSKP